MRAFKTIISLVIALFIAGIFMSLLLTVMRLALSVLFEFSILVVVIIMALPLYVIIRKKLFR